MINSEYQEVIKAARLGGQVIKKYFGQNLAVKLKSTIHDFQTKADLESEKAVIGHLQKKFPGYNILSEEIGYIDKNSEYTFIIDPLDGSNNFVFLDRVYWAQKGKGAYCDGKKIHVSRQSGLKDSNIAYNCGYIFSRQEYAKIFKKLQVAEIKRYLTSWSVALDFCLLAAGRIDGIINNKCEVYDFIAGRLIASEAGAVITDFKGQKDEDKNNRFIASCGKKIHQDILKIL